MKPLYVLGCALAVTMQPGCHQACPAPDDDPSGPAWFADVTDGSGLDFVHDAGPVDGRYFMPQSLGSGAAVLDYDNDGRPDLYLLHNGGPQGARNRLFHQEADGHFRDVSAGSGLDIAGYNMGVAVGDVNNDGWPDVLVTQYGGVRLFLNNGNGTFTDVTKEAGLSNPGWGASAAFFDYDRDGWLDLVVVNYVDYDPAWPCTTTSGQPQYCGPTTFPKKVSRLFRNRGSGDGRRVQFEDVTVSSGLAGRAGPGLGVVCADFDGDGWPDIFIANDGLPNHLWMNHHDGTFTEEAAKRGAAYNAVGVAQAGMGVAVGDVDGDGLLDLVVTHMPEEYNTLWQQGPCGLFSDRTAAAGLASPRHRATGFGTALADFDQDGALDAAVVNGRIRAAPSDNPALGPHWSLYAEHNQLFANDGKGHFRDVSAENPAFCGTANVARGLACADVDGDGGLDLLVTTVAGRARLLRNVAPRRGHWLLVRALDSALHRDAYGARVTVRAGGRRWVRLVNPAGSYLTSGDVRAHFGLGPAERTDAVEVLWPDGTAETFPGSAADRVLVLRKGEGKPGDKETDP
jgi:hypothetical protein